MTDRRREPALDLDTTEPHEFDPRHPDWHKPRCKVCREFEDHELHRERWRCGRCLLLKDAECSCGWPFSFRAESGGGPDA